MSLSKITCLLELSSKFDVSDYTSKKNIMSPVYVATMVKNIEGLGFTFSKKMMTKLGEIGESDLVSIYKTIVPILKKMKGANVVHKPMYPNFPEQVMEASDALLYINAMVHYIGIAFGVNILPETELKERFPLIGNYKLQVIDLALKNEYATAINNLMTASIAISATQKKYVSEFYAENKSTFKTPEMPNKENLAYVAGLLYADKNLDGLTLILTTPTDVLRFITALNDGDISLAENTKFKSMKRAERRLIMGLLDGMKSLPENMVKYKNKWLRVGEMLHVGEYNTRFPKTYTAFKMLRDGSKIETFNSKVESLLNDGKYLNAATLLSERPTDLTRRLDFLLRKSKNQDRIVAMFKSVADKVPTNVLLNIISHFENRNEAKDTRMFFPKGNMAKVQVIKNELPSIKKDTCNEIVKIVSKLLVKRFADQGKMGKVYIDDVLKGINVPFALRSASHSFKTIARGSRVAIPGDKKILRMFTYWKNGLKAGVKPTEDHWDGDRIDIDLACLFLNDKFEDAGHVSWTNLRYADNGTDGLSTHSGDITTAPNGASEFIDIDIDKAVKQGLRYAAINIYCFTGQNFSDMNECFAGVMFRDEMKSGEIYDAKTVEHKYDLTAAGTASIPLIFDLEKRELIWLDLAMKDRGLHFGRVAEGQKKNMSAVVQGIVEISKPNLHDLLTLHAKGRGKIVKNRKAADKIYDLEFATNSIPEILTLI